MNKKIPKKENGGNCYDPPLNNKYSLLCSTELDLVGRYGN